ncbi:head completion protein [Cyanophage S-SSM6b]|nr:head completion protein [Cyanophage S-SSM6b]
MKWCDVTPTVTEWGSEEIIIPYISPVDGKRHRYFPDFYVKVGKKKYIVEVKPFRQTLEPKTQKRVTKRYINEVVTFSVNQAKWKAAREFCKDNSLEFMLITEKELKV